MVVNPQSENAVDEYRLEDIASAHKIGTDVFVPFVIARLGKAQDTNEAMLTVRMNNIGNDGERQRKLRICWSADNAPKKPPAVGERTITEWAACGIACAVLAAYSNLHLSAVTINGDRFDYWVSDGQREYGLEVSGTTKNKVEPRHCAKMRQLLANPFGVDGYVIVTGFTTHEVIFSFHRFEEEVDESTTTKGHQPQGIRRQL
jgi:hypothetical protein